MSICLKIAAGMLLAAALSPAQQRFTPACKLPFEGEAVEVIDGSCNADGGSVEKPASTAKVAENRAKNNFCATGKPLPVTYDAFLNLQKAAEDADLKTIAKDNRAKLAAVSTLSGKKIGEGTLVQYVAFIADAHYSNIGSGESVNCYRRTKAENDIHIVLVQGQDDDPCDSVTAEMSPHYRPAAWTDKNLNALASYPVRITGPLFFDSSHVPCRNGKRASPPRASVWEIHPVYAIEVCNLSSLRGCAGPQAVWVALEDWFNQKNKPATRAGTVSIVPPATKQR